MIKTPLTINELKSDSEFNYEAFTKEALISTIVSIRDYICNLEKELGSNNKRLSRVAENRYDKILELEQENEQLKEQLQANKKARKEAIKYINVTEYSGIVGLNKNGIKEFWFVKDLLKILDIDKGE